MCVVTTAEDMHTPTFQRMLSSLPRGCELVVLVNHIGADSDTQHMADDDTHGVHVRLYSTTRSTLNLAWLRNECARYATRTWCMWLDADDAIIGGDVAELVRGAKPSVGAYYAQCVGMQSIDGAHVTHYSTSQLRIWRRSLGDVWLGYAHEIIDRRRIEAAGYVIAYADIVIHHAGYVCDQQRQLMRLSRNVYGVMRTLIDLWDGDIELRSHYLRVLADNLNMYNQLEEMKQCQA